MYDHGVTTVWVGAGPHEFDQQGWDSGQIGFIYTTPERYRQICEEGDGAPEKLKPTWRKHAEKILRAEIETWDQYMTGDVYGYTVEVKATGEEVDSCWGFYGREDVMAEMKASLESAVKAEKKAEAMVKSTFAL